MRKNNVITNVIIIVFVLFLFCISNCIKISFLTQPKLFGLLITIFAVFLWFYNRYTFKRNDVCDFVKNLSIGFILFASVILISTFLNHKFEITYIFEVIRPIIYMLCTFVFFVIFKRKEQINFFNKILYVLIPLFLLIGFVQFNNIGNINDLYIRIIAPTQSISLTNGYAYPRIVGLLSNPNAYAYVLSLFNLYLLYIFIKNYVETHKTSALIIICLIINRVIMYMTGSRTAFIVCIMSELIFVFFTLLLEKGKINFKSIQKPFVFCIAILLVELGIMFSLPTKYSWRIKTLITNDLGSWDIRKSKTSEVIDFYIIDNNETEIANNQTVNNDENNGNNASDNVTENNNASDNNSENNLTNEEDYVSENIINNKFIRLFFGTGPIKDGFAFDNEWVQIFIAFGFFGIMAFVNIHLLGARECKKSSLLFKIFFLSICVLNSVYMIAAGSYFSYDLFISFLLFIMLVYMGEKNEKER